METATVHVYCTRRKQDCDGQTVFVAFRSAERFTGPLSLDLCTPNCPTCSRKIEQPAGYQGPFDAAQFRKGVENILAEIAGVATERHGIVDIGKSFVMEVRKEAVV